MKSLVLLLMMALALIALCAVSVAVTASPPSSSAVSAATLTPDLVACPAGVAVPAVLAATTASPPTMYMGTGTVATTWDAVPAVMEHASKQTSSARHGGALVPGLVESAVFTPTPKNA